MGRGVVFGQPERSQPSENSSTLHQYVLESVWGDVQPSADGENTFLESHSWDDYADWHLALTDGRGGSHRARYAFVYGDFGTCAAA